MFVPWNFLIYPTVQNNNRQNIYISSTESQKGINALQCFSIENQKGMITIQSEAFNTPAEKWFGPENVCTMKLSGKSKFSR